MMSDKLLLESVSVRTRLTGHFSRLELKHSLNIADTAVDKKVKVDTQQQLRLVRDLKIKGEIRSLKADSTLTFLTVSLQSPIVETSSNQPNQLDELCCWPFDIFERSSIRR